MGAKTGYEVFVDGASMDIFFYKGDDPLGDAMKFALKHAQGYRSIQVVTLAGMAEKEAWYFDYELDDWVYVSDARQAKPRAKAAEVEAEADQRA